LKSTIKQANSLLRGNASLIFYFLLAHDCSQLLLLCPESLDDVRADKVWRGMQRYLLGNGQAAPSAM